VEQGWYSICATDSLNDKLLWQVHHHGNQAMPFKDIFVIQILGMLIARKFSGIASLVIGNNSDNVASIWFESGMVVKVRYSNFPDIQALKAIAWENNGSLELSSQVFPLNPLEHYSLIVEKLLKDTPISIIDTCPMLMNSFITRAKLKPLKNSPSSLAGLSLLAQIGSGSQLTNIQKGNLSETEFWDGFWYLTCHGLVINSYAKSIGVLIQQFQDSLTEKMNTLMGYHIAQVYTEKLWQNIQHRWPDWEKGKEPDPIYGTSPYKLWAQMVRETTKQVGTQTLQKRGFESVLSAFSSEDLSVINNFLI